jgi:hypothetical protein
VSKRRLAHLHRRRAELLEQQAAVDKQIALEIEAPSLSPQPPPVVPPPAASSRRPAGRRRRARAPAQPSGPVDDVTLARVRKELEKK